jgi:glycosyltransferase involved in cell wall biosynthesis
MKLSVCFVTRNEERNIERAIRSVSSIASEVIVADTGSTDRTVAAATALGATVIDIPWDDDFAAARNRALDAAGGDWILWMNPDEELPPAGQSNLLRALENEAALGFYLLVCDQHKGNQSQFSPETLQLRAFRRNAGIRYLGRLHPHLDKPIEQLAEDAGKVVEYAEGVIVIRHADSSVLTPEKLRWAAKLLELELRDRPGQIHYMIEYGRTLLRLNDPKGHEVLAEAAEKMLLHREESVAPNATVASLVEYLLTVSREQNRSQISIAETRDLAWRWFPRSPPIVWALAGQFFRNRSFAQAARLLEVLIQMGQTGVYDRSMAFDPTIMRAPAVINLGACYAELGEFKKAEVCYGQLLNHPTLGAEAMNNYAKMQSASKLNSE